MRIHSCRGQNFHYTLYLRAALRREKAKRTTLESQFETCPIGMHIIDLRGKIISVNRRWRELLGYTSKEVIGREIFDFIAPEQRENARTRFSERMKGTDETRMTPRIGEREYVTKDGERICVETHNSPVRNRQGKTVGMQTSIEDITERMTAQARVAELEATVRQAEYSALVGNMFTDLSHLYRHHLLVLANDLEKLEFFGVSAELLSPIRIKITTIQTLIDNLMVSLSGEVKVVSLTEELRSIYDFFRELARSRGISIHLDISSLSPDDGAAITSLGLRLIIENLVTNAIEAFSNGASDKTIKISAEKIGANICVRVQDNGPGIPANVASSVFIRPFTTKASGSGIGLTSVKRATDAAHGRISFSSTPAGTTFEVLLPFVPFSKPKEIVPHPKTVSTRSLSILLVDDDYDDAEFILNHLRKQGHSVTVCSDSTTALAQCQSQEFDLVVTDLNMPKMMGHTLIEEIAKLGKSTFFILQTGNDKEALSDKTTQVIQSCNAELLLKTSNLREAMDAAISKLFPPDASSDHQ